MDHQVDVDKEQIQAKIIKVRSLSLSYLVGTAFPCVVLRCSALLRAPRVCGVYVRVITDRDARFLISWHC